MSRVVVGVHKLTSRTSVGVLDWSCCSLALLPALIPVSCRYCWPCCRLVASTRSICSWHALKQSWNKKGSDVIRHTHTSVTPLLVFKCSEDKLAIYNQATLWSPGLFWLMSADFLCFHVYSCMISFFQHKFSYKSDFF